MNLRFSAVLAAREARHGLRRVGVYMASITLGVAALVSIHSFRADVARSVQDEAEKLMGANARLSANRAFPDTIDRVLDSLAASGVGTARVTTAMSMVAAPTSGGVRLLQVQGIAGDFPFYGTVTTRPADVWGAQGDPGRALVDPAVLSQLGIQVGDSLVVGGRRFEIAGVVEDMPTDVGFQTAIGPRVFLSARAMADAGILGFGSLARYQAFLRMPDPVARARVEERYRTVFRQSQVRFTTADRQARNLANGIRFLGRYLALVGLGALLLGGIGVASAIHVYVRERRDSVAVLRCVGGTQWTLFHAYLIQAAGLGLLGSLAGVVLGVGVQRLLPVALADVLPVDVATRFSVSSALAGLGVGVWVAVIFALIPLLEVRNVPPLAALRRDFEAARRGWDGWRFAAYVAVGVSVTALCVLKRLNRKRAWCSPQRWRRRSARWPARGGGSRAPPTASCRTARAIRSGRACPTCSVPGTRRCPSRWLWASAPSSWVRSSRSRRTCATTFRSRSAADGRTSCSSTSSPISSTA